MSNTPTSWSSGLPNGITLLTDPKLLQRYAPSKGQGPAAVVQPRSMDDLRALMPWAKQHHLGLIPISSADGPRRHGSTVAYGPAVVVDLSGLNRVRHVDAQDAIAVIEPGITFPAFDAQLAAHGLRSFKPLLPRRSKSVLASHLEREPIISPREQWDSCDPFGAAQLVFGTGEPFRTGSAAPASDLEEQLAKGLRQMTPMGPFALDFLRVTMGAQGTMSVVTWAAVHCERIPALERAFFVGSDHLEPLAELSARIGWRKLAAHTFIVNGFQLALMLGGSREQIMRLHAQLPPWVLFVNIAAPNYLPEQRIAFETAALREDAAAHGLRVDEALAGQRADRLMQLHHDLPGRYHKDHLGDPWDEIFFLSQTDRAAHFVQAFDTVHETKGSGAPVAIYIQPRVQGSSCHIEFTTFWQSAHEQQRASFHQHASAQLSTQGAYFSRPYGLWSQLAYDRDAQIVPYLREAKRMLDPDGVLNPGKLCFGPV